jgi:hypothetical protein
VRRTPIPPLAAALLFTAAVVSQSAAPSLAEPSGCMFLSGGGPAAFCDTFDAPSGNRGPRTGDLDSVVWGASHSTTDLLNWQEPFALNKCGSQVLVSNPEDIQICDGKLVEGMADGGNVSTLAMYPRQPFDIAGRTGTVVFDVSNDTQGSHAAWPSFVYSDQPVPAPSTGAGDADYARNSFGVSFAFIGQDAAGKPCAGVDGMWMTTNYVYQQLKVERGEGCGGAAMPPADSLILNHVEVKLRADGAEVYAGDAGRPETTKLIAAAHFAMPLSRGLVWMEDTHYNACKEPDTQCTHTFAWDNFGFDGPVLPRDLGYQIADNTLPSDNGWSEPPSHRVDIGYRIPPTGTPPLALTFNGVADPQAANGALFEFSYFTLIDDKKDTRSWEISANGHPAHHQSWVLPSPPPDNMKTGFSAQTIAVPIPPEELAAGDNTFTITTDDPGGMTSANYDLILIGAGGR